jgi:hypothetical protein
MAGGSSRIGIREIYQPAAQRSTVLGAGVGASVWKFMAQTALPRWPVSEPDSHLMC